jgi:hypothetical protein
VLELQTDEGGDAHLEPAKGVFLAGQPRREGDRARLQHAERDGHDDLLRRKLRVRGRANDGVPSPPCDARDDRVELHGAKLAHRLFEQGGDQAVVPANEPKLSLGARPLVGRGGVEQRLHADLRRIGGVVPLDEPQAARLGGSIDVDPVHEMLERLVFAA